MPLPPAGSRPWYRNPVGLLFAAAVVARTAALARFARTPYFLQQMGDMRFYHAWAERILAGQWTDGHAFYGLPGYAFLLAGIYHLTGPGMVLRAAAVGFLQACLEGGTAAIIFILARRSCESERPEEGNPSPRLAPGLAAAAGVAWILFLPAQTFSLILMPTAWLVCAWWAGVWLLSRERETSVWLPWLPLGVGIGIVCQLVATILFLLPLALARLFLSVAPRQPWRGRLPRLLAASLLLFGGVGLGSSPAWLHNRYIAHDPVFLSAHSGLNFWMGNNPEATGYPKVPPGLRTTQEGLLRDSLTWPEQQLGRPLLRSEVSRFWSEKAHRYIAEHPGAWARLMAVKVRNFCHAFTYDDLSVITLFRERGVLWPGLSWGVVAVFGLAGLPWAVWRRSPARWVAAAVGLHLLAILPVFITERYRLAAAPGLLILGVTGLSLAWEAARRAAWSALAGYAALLAGAAALCFRPVADPTLLALDPFNVGVKELAAAELLPRLSGTPAEQEENRREAAQELQRAQEHLEKAFAQVPGDPGITFALGNLWLRRGDPARGRAWYERTLALQPGFTSAHLNLGQLALDEKAFPAAEEHFAAGVRSDPENMKGWYLLALARQGRGDLAGARAAVAESLRLAPGQPQVTALQAELGPGPAAE